MGYDPEAEAQRFQFVLFLMIELGAGFVALSWLPLLGSIGVGLLAGAAFALFCRKVKP